MTFIVLDVVTMYNFCFYISIQTSFSATYILSRNSVLSYTITWNVITMMAVNNESGGMWKSNSNLRSPYSRPWRPRGGVEVKLYARWGGWSTLRPLRLWRSSWLDLSYYADSFLETEENHELRLHCGFDKILIVYAQKALSRYLPAYTPVSQANKRPSSSLGKEVTSGRRRVHRRKQQQRD